MYSTPMPLGACSLWPEKESKSTCRYSSAEIDPHLADRLRGVAMEDDRGIGFLGQPGELLDGKDDARLVVGVHDAHQQRLGTQGADELADVEIAVAVDVQPGDAAAVALEILADLQHGRVLDRVVMICRRLGLALAAPKIAVLLLSEAQPVKRIGLASARPKCRATACRARSRASWTRWAGSYIELGLK